VTTPPDAPARAQIAGALGRTLFVEAGAGSGKTQSLVDRVVATVLDQTAPVPLRQIAAVTFTEKAGAELRDRLRAALERASAQGSPAAAQALDELDAAAIGTLHSFARRILTEHPIEAGLPPLIEVMDEVASGVAFDQRYADLRNAILDDETLTPALLLAMSAGMGLDDLRSLALAFTNNWDLIAPRVLAGPDPELVAFTADAVLADARELAALAVHCGDVDDLLLPTVQMVGVWAQQLAEAPDDPSRVAVFGDLPTRNWHLGQKGNWACPVDEVRAAGRRLVDDARSLRTRVLDGALRVLARRIGTATLADAQARRTNGRLEFHDLLVLCRDLLRSPSHGAAVRETLQQRYRRLLLDEFQDTDPIQIELAVRIAAGASADAPQWWDVVVPPGSLFVVGDPKQSIYRFRRADIGVYLRAQERIGERVVLDSNFRTGGSILTWINHVFGQLILAVPGSQPEFRPLQAVRPDAPGGPPVVVLGAQVHDKSLTAAQLREREAVDVVNAIRTALTERWQVHDGPGWRDVTLPDIAILLPTRTSLPQLEQALDEAGIGYHSEASSLVYRASEVREVLAAARALDDPSDQLSLVTALRSRLFGCGDDDLWTWAQAGGRWDILRPPPESLSPNHSVAQAMAYLRRLHYDSAWLAPSETLARIIDERRLLEVAVDGPRARDVWRRLRFVVDQARAWAETEHAGLRAYLSWVTRQGSDTARAAEAVLPETDTQTLRIMTIHAAKGMEFPVVIVAGATGQPGGARRGVEVLWPADGGYEVRLRKDLRTANYDDALPIDEQMSDHERRRLLYVACTRARDHLVVSAHRKERSWKSADDADTFGEMIASVADGAPSVTLTGAPDGEVAWAGREALVPPPPLRYPQWISELHALRSRAARPSAISASQLEGSASALEDLAPAAAAMDAIGQPLDPGLAKDARDLELPPWNKGRYGTAVGRAVHAVMQTVDLATGAGLADAVAAQTLAEGVVEYAELVAQLARSALASEVVGRAATRPSWRETYVGTTVGDQVVEGIVDLLYRDEDGLVIVDYKTDAVPAPAQAARVDFYRPQMAVYAMAVEAAVGEPVTRCVLLFLSPTGAMPAVLHGLADAVAQLRAGLPQPA
jgi:ATP-dependent helicase/nuclease subunit A